MLRPVDFKRRTARPDVLRRRLARVRKVLGIAILINAVVLALGLLGVNSRFGRNLIKEQVTVALAPLFRGKLSLTEIGRVGFGEVRGVDAIVRDEAGRVVLRAQDIEAQIGVFSTLTSLLSSDSDIELVFTHTRIGHVEVLLDVDREGIPFLARAFEPVPSQDQGAAPGPAHEASKSSRNVQVRFPRADIEHAWVHGKLESLPALDVELQSIRGAVHVMAASVAIEVLQVTLKERSMWQGKEVNGTATVSLDIPFTEQDPIRLGTSFRGALGALPIASVATLKGNELYAAAALDRTSAQGIRDVLPSFPIHQPVSAGLEAKGTLPLLKLDGYFQAGASQALALGSMNIDDPISAEFDVRIRNFDLRTLGPDLPQSNFDAALAVQGQVDGRVTGTVTVAIDAGQVADVRVPPIRAQGEFSNETATLNGSLSDGSGSATFQINGRTERDEYVMGIDVSANSDDLSRYATAISKLSGKLQLNGEGEFRLGDRVNSDFTVLARANELHIAGAELATSVACVHFFGDLEDPELTLELSAEQLVYQNRHISHATVLANGSLSNLDVKLSLEAPEDQPSLYANTALKLTDESVELIEPHLILWRKRGALDVRAERVRMDSGGISVKRGIVEGAGNRLELEGQLGRAALSLSAHSRGLRIHDLAYVLGRDGNTHGVLDMDLDLVASHTRTLGKVALSLERADIEKIGKGFLRANLTLEERRLAGTIIGDIGPYYLRMHADDVRLAGPVRAARSWREATGAIALDADIDLGRLKAALPERSIPFDVMTGSLEASGKLERSQVGAPPQVAFQLKTQGLQIYRKGEEQPRFDGKVVQAPPKWKLNGVDFDVATRITGANGSTHFTGRAFDHQGTIVALTFDADVPYRALVANQRAALRRLSDLPIRAQLNVPRRKMDTLPAPLRIKGVAGELEVQLDFKQEQSVPAATLLVGAHRLQFQERADAIPITAEARMDYRGDRGKLDVKLACADQPTLTGSSQVTGDLSKLIRGELSTMNWRAVTRVDAARFPLRAIPILAERRVQGSLTGTTTLDIANDARPKVDGSLKFEGLKIGEVKYTTGELNARLDDDSLQAAAELRQRDGGFLTVSARVERPPEARDPPQESQAKGTFDAATIEAKASRFRASAVQPFLQGTVAQLDGLVDGQVKLNLNGQQSQLGGNLELRQGRLQLETFGEELRGVEGKIAFRPNGVIVLESVRARGVSGKIEATGRAKMNGLSLAEAHATVNIPKRKPLPVVIEGESMAEAWANLDLDITQRGHATHATVSVRKAGIRIPEKSAHDLQVLGPPPEIRVGVQRTPTQFVILPTTHDKGAESAVEAEPVRIILNLNNVEVRRGSTLRTRLDGQLSVAAGQNNDVRGQIRLSKGSLDVEGKRFEIERGVITFVGDPGNPQVVLTAGWTAPEGTRVYADFIGPLKTGKVTLRAEPARTQGEILSLILFGTTDGQAVPVSSGQQSSDPGASGAALGVGGGIATQGINRALDDITGLDVTTRVDTADSSNPRPEIEVQIAQDIALSIAHVLGTPSAAEGLDRNFLTLDWRFLRNWSLETTFGDRGSVVMDAVWQLRY